MHLERMARHRGYDRLAVRCALVGVSTLSTVGYGDVYPVTPEGRLAAMVLMILGIGLFSAITASITSYLVSTGRSADASGGGLFADELERLAGLREQGSLTEDEFSLAKRRLLGG